MARNDYILKSWKEIQCHVVVVISNRSMTTYIMASSTLSPIRWSYCYNIKRFVTIKKWLLMNLIYQNVMYCFDVKIGNGSLRFDDNLDYGMIDKCAWISKYCSIVICISPNDVNSMIRYDKEWGGVEWFLDQHKWWVYNNSSWPPRGKNLYNNIENGWDK